jgi:hypothetical protein
MGRTSKPGKKWHSCYHESKAEQYWAICNAISAPRENYADKESHPVAYEEYVQWKLNQRPQRWQVLDLTLYHPGMNDCGSGPSHLLHLEHSRVTVTRPSGLLSVSPLKITVVESAPRRDGVQVKEQPITSTVLKFSRWHIWHQVFNYLV